MKIEIKCKNSTKIQNNFYACITLLRITIEWNSPFGHWSLSVDQWWWISVGRHSNIHRHQSQQFQFNAEWLLSDKKFIYCSNIFERGKKQNGLTVFSTQISFDDDKNSKKSPQYSILLSCIKYIILLFLLVSTNNQWYWTKSKEKNEALWIK